MTDNQRVARQMWQLLEPVHAVLYYAPQATQEAAALGYDTRSRWPSYFAWRAAPMGAAGSWQVASAFYSFSPRMVAEHVPGVWETAHPDDVLAGRLRGVDRALRALLGDRVDAPEMAEAAALVREAAESARTAGRPLAAANADLPWPPEAHLQLWQAATILREQRGDGHVAALLTTGLDPCEALVSFAALGVAPVEVFASRGWADDEWAAARHRLAGRGWVDADGSATSRGRLGRDHVERLTDQLASRPWQALGPGKTGRLANLVVPLMQTIVATGILPRQSTLGLRGSGPPGQGMGGAA
jgi:hypothetical protein